MGLITDLRLKSARYGGGATFGGGWGNINDFLDNPANWAHWGRSSGRVVRVSMGQRDVSPVVGSSQGLPQLVPETPTRTAIPLPPAIDRRDIPQIPNSVSQDLGDAVLNDDEWYRQLFGKDRPPVGMAAPQTIVGETPVDLGDIYDVIDGSLGGVLPGGVPLGSVPITGGVPGAVSAYVGTPAAPVVTTAQGQAPASCGGGAPVYKKVCGEYRWVYPKRRRRKKLATKSDITALAQLKGVLGMGKAMETWIATHS